MSIIDLSQLPPPDVVEQLDMEASYQSLLADFRRLMGDAWTAALESDPVVKLLELAAYREAQLRARINDAAHAVMLAYAMGADLDHKGADDDIARLDGEDDERFRQRIQQGLHRLAAAGPANAYRQYALGVSADIADVDVWSAAEGNVTVVVLARALTLKTEASAADISAGLFLFGLAPDDSHAYVIAQNDHALMRAVEVALNPDDVRPLTDHVIVRGPTVQTFALQAVIEVLPGPDADMIRARRELAANAYLASVRRLGSDVTRAGIIAALVEPGVKNVRLPEPVADIVCGHGELAVCTSIVINAEVVDA